LGLLKYVFILYTVYALQWHLVKNKFNLALMLSKINYTIISYNLLYYSIHYYYDVIVNKEIVITCILGPNENINKIL